jgi:hypothetical protein
MKIDHESMEKEKDRRKDLMVAEIKAAGFGAMQDINENKISDFQDVMRDIKSSDEFSQVMNFDREKQTNQSQQHQDKMTLEREKLATQKQMKDADLQIARENQTKAELQAARKLAQDKKKK